MRVTQTLTQQQFLASLNTLESNLSNTQNQISSNLSFTTASQNPIAAGTVNNYNQALAQAEQFDTNANSAQTNLNTEDSALSSVQNNLQSLRTLVLEANSSSLTDANRAAIATQAQAIQQSLLSLANTQNGNGEYIFGGYSASSAPFSASATGATYSGDQGQRYVQIGAGQSVADGDNGNTVFNEIKTGNGTFTVSSAAGNTGGGLVGATSVTNAAAYTGGTYAINFSSPTAYTVVNTATNATVTTGTYTDGQAITFSGVSVTLSGAPAAGDSFTVAPSKNQSLFTTVQNIITTLQTTSSVGSGSAATRNNQLTAEINNIDQALDNVSDVQTSVGGRLNAITSQLSVSSNTQLQLKSSIATLQGLDYATAVTTLDQQNTTLSAAMQAYTLTQGLSLFKYL